MTGNAAGRAPRGLLAVLIWLVGSVLPKRRDRIVVHSIPDWEDGALAVVAELRRRGHRPVLLLEPSGLTCPDVVLGADVVQIPKNSWRGRWTYLTAAFVITTHTVYRPHRLIRGQSLVNLWHGERLGKRVGRWDGQPGLPATWALACSVVGQAFRCVQMDLPPERVLVVGAPRNDRMLTADQDAIRERHLRPTARYTLLWLPTYRLSAVTGRVDGDADNRASLGFAREELDDLDSWLAAHEVDVLVKPHPLARPADWSSRTHLRWIGPDWINERGHSLYELLAAVDGLVTDASAVWVDHLLLDRPMIFAFPDIATYRARRGLLLEPFEDWVPGPLATTMPEVIAALDDLVSGRDAYQAARREWLARAHRFRDASSTTRLLDAVGLGDSSAMPDGAGRGEQ